MLSNRWPEITSLVLPVPSRLCSLLNSSLSSFFLPFGSQFTLYPRRSGGTWVCIDRTQVCECHVASCTSLKMSCTITDPSPLAQTLLLEVRAVCTYPRAFHSPGRWASASKPHSITSQFSPFSSCFWGSEPQALPGGLSVSEESPTENNPERGWKMDVFWIEKLFHCSMKSNVWSFVFIY